MGYAIFQEAYRALQSKICCLLTAFPVCYFVFQSADHQTYSMFSKLAKKHLI